MGEKDQNISRQMKFALLYFFSFGCSAGIDNSKNEIIYDKLLNIFDTDTKEKWDTGSRIVGMKLSQPNVNFFMLYLQVERISMLQFLGFCISIL